MSRARIYGLSPLQRDRIFEYDRLSPGDRKRASYDVRQFMDESIESWEFLLSSAPELFRRQRYKEYQFPLEAILPMDPKKGLSLTTERIDGWIKRLQDIKAYLELFKLQAYHKY